MNHGARTFATVNGRSVFYTRSGSALAKLVLVPPLGGNTASYGPEFDELAGVCEMVKYDWGGQGISEKLPFQYDMDYLVSELVGLLDFLGWDHVDGVGVAAGSAILLSAAAAYPQRFRKLALMSPCAFVPESGGASMRERASAVAQRGMRVSLEASLARGFAPAYGKDEELRAQYSGEYLANDPAAYARASIAFSYYDQATAMPQITQECLLLPGQFDPYFPVALSEAMIEQLPNATLSVLDGCGHFSQLERPREIVIRIIDFLRC